MLGGPGENTKELLPGVLAEGARPLPPEENTKGLLPGGLVEAGDFQSGGFEGVDAGGLAEKVKVFGFAYEFKRGFRAPPCRATDTDASIPMAVATTAGAVKRIVGVGGDGNRALL